MKRVAGNAVVFLVRLAIFVVVLAGCMIAVVIEFLRTSKKSST